MKPIVVYLDTSDFSEMYSMKEKESVAQVRRALEEHVRRDNILIGVSYVHFFEFLQPADGDHINDRYDRAEFLKRLSSGWSFPFYMDLNNDSRIRRGPYWIPAEAMEAIEVEKFVRMLQKRLVDQSTLHPELFPNRNSRRKLKNRDVFVNLVREHPKVMARNDSLQIGRDYYEGLLQSGLLRQYLLGELSREKANEVLRSSVLSPASVYYWFFENGNNENPITQGLESLKAEWDDNFKKIEDALRIASDQIILLKKSENDPSWKRSREEMRMIRKHRNQLRGFINRPVSFSDFVLCRGYNREDVNIQFRTGASELVGAVAAGKIEFVRSLLGDLLHSLYLPYCDLWRGDKRFSNLLTSGKVPNSDKVVSRLVDLPGRINQLLT